jgi:hypothetical protein
MAALDMLRQEHKKAEVIFGFFVSLTRLFKL